MSEVVAELATIEISRDLMELVDIKSVMSKFRDNYNKLGDLKKFRTDYEKRSALGRLWHRGDLKNAQLSAVEVQADFSQTIGQLLMISIMQSKMLSNQQSVLNDQQIGLKAQADCIQAHTAKIETQHGELKEQSEKLENLVKEYFALKGLTENGAEKLIQIAKEVKATKLDMVAQFDIQVVKVVEVSRQLIQQVEEQHEVVDKHLKRISEEVNKELQLLRDEALNSKAQVESTLRAEVGSVRLELGRVAETNGEQFASLSNGMQEVEEHIAKQRVIISELDEQLCTQRADIETALLKGIELQFQTEKVEAGLETYQFEISQVHEKLQTKIHRLIWVSGLGMVTSFSLLAWLFVAMRGR